MTAVVVPSRDICLVPLSCGVRFGKVRGCDHGGTGVPGVSADVTVTARPPACTGQCTHAPLTSLAGFRLRLYPLPFLETFVYICFPCLCVLETNLHTIAARFYGFAKYVGAPVPFESNNSFYN